MDHNIAVSFVHGYSDLDYEPNRESLPALWIMSPEGEKVYNFPFPRNVSDFETYKELLSGPSPMTSAKDFKKLPRFGLTGLSQNKTHLFAGSWNGVYQIRKSDYGLERIITNNLMNDLHGIYADDQQIITVLTGKDAVVISDFEGNVIDCFTVANDLSIHRDDRLGQIDWRFLSKQFRGATGLWHFNFVQRFDDEIWLTSRNTGAFVVVNLTTNKAYLRMMNQKTPVLLHDGVRHDDGLFYFTSIDGKILIASEALSKVYNPREEFEGVELFTRDLVCELIRLEDTELGREPNWCRGIACHNETMFVTIDGRYDTDLSFGVIGLDRKGKLLKQSRLKWADVGSEKDLRYVTGFDLVTF